MQPVTLLIFASLITLGQSKLRFVLDEDIFKCSDKPWLIDLTNFKLVMIDDETTIANGTSVILKTIKSPWGLHLLGEQYDRGQWSKRFERKFDDFCQYNLKLGEIWYDSMYKKLKGKKCPYEKGESFDCDEEKVYFDLSFMPPYFQGRWRFTMDGYLGCFRVHFDFVDD